MIEEVALRKALRRVPWVTDVRVHDELPSTNEEAVLLAGRGSPHGTVVVAGAQTAGRGRLGRSWWSEAGGSLTASWIVRPEFSVEAWPLLALAAGLASARGIARRSELDVGLKWPNDLLVGDRKAGGILVEARPPEFLVVGLGVNLSGSLPPELRDTAVNLAAAGGKVPALGDLLATILEEFGVELADVGGIAERYRQRCATLGRRVRVALPGGKAVEGIATDIDRTGSLIVRETAGEIVLPAGDVVHLRDAG